jgi:hypothetical protein
MNSKAKQVLRVALHGMDGRSYKTMEMYLRGPCKGNARVVLENEAEIDIIDADHPTAASILENRRLQTPDRPIILLSLQTLKIDNTLFVKKPVESANLLDILKQAKQILDKQKVDSAKHIDLLDDTTDFKLKIKAETPLVKEISSKNIDQNELKNMVKNKTSVYLNEGGFSSFFGVVANIDFDDPEQLPLASYNIKNSYLYYVTSAFKVAKVKGGASQLNCGWKPLLIFPHSSMIWLDADDKQLMAFSGITISKELGFSIDLTPVNLTSWTLNKDLDKCQSMEAFVWKLAIWTSKGRFPDAIDFHKQIYLKQWPNFTRLVVTPHALRIAALLMQGPRSMLNIANVLNINPKYVFVFVSACYALDLIGIAQRVSDELVVPEKIEPSKKQSLFSKILNKLLSSM